MFKKKALYGSLLVMLVIFFSMPAWADTEVETNNTPVAIPDNAYDGSLASMACSSVNIASDGTDIVDGAVQVGIAIDHTYVGDLVFKLESPSGTITTLMSRPGLTEPDDGITATCCGWYDDLSSGSPVSFLNTGATDAENMGAIAVGVVCQDDGLCQYFPNPGAGPGTDLADFDGENAVGTWQFCVGDGAGADVGTLVSWTLTVDTTSSNFVTDLIAGGGGQGKSAMDVGDVLVWNDADNLYVKYVADAPWCITETHLQVATSLEGIPQKKGNPIPGLFDYSGIHECVPEVVYTIPLGDWTPGDTVYLAAHAVVAQEVVVDDSSYFQYETAWGAGYVFPGKNWATYITYGVECTYNPAIDIEKSTNGEDADTPLGPSIPVGDPVTWQYIVTNTGDVALEYIFVTDDQGVAVSCPKDTLDPGESMTCTASGTATEGQYANMGTATGTDVCGNSPSDSDPSHYFGEVPPTECAHDVCVTGDPLDPACDPCVEIVCGLDTYCCGAGDGNWDSLCVCEAQDFCAIDCGATGCDDS